MTVEETKAQLWARVYADCLARKLLWFHAKEEANRAIYWFDRRDEKEKVPA